MKKWIETHLWTFSLILVTLLSPVIIWEAWELITSFSAVPIRILLGVAILAVTYIGLVVLLLWSETANTVVSDHIFIEYETLVGRVKQYLMRLCFKCSRLGCSR